MEFLKNELIVGINGYIWIGAHEIDGDWNWQDGSKFDWTNWEKTQPNSPRWADGINDCAYLWGKQDFEWADAKCNDEYNFPFICMHQPLINVLLINVLVFSKDEKMLT